MAKKNKTKSKSKKVKDRVIPRSSSSKNKTGRPYEDRILIKEISRENEEKTSSGIIIPASSEKDSMRMGEVVSVGLGKSEEGKLIAPNLSPGDRVLFQWGEKVTIKGSEYLIVRNSDIVYIF